MNNVAIIAMVIKIRSPMARLRIYQEPNDWLESEDENKGMANVVAENRRTAKPLPGYSEQNKSWGLFT